MDDARYEHYRHCAQLTTGRLLVGAPCVGKAMMPDTPMGGSHRSATALVDQQMTRYIARIFQGDVAGQPLAPDQSIPVPA
jgi:hypothetical protein